MFSYLKSFWNTLSRIGQDQEGQELDQQIILLNQIAVVCILCNLCLMPFYIYLGDPFSLLILVIVSVIELIPILLNRFRKFYASKVYAVLIGPLLIGGLMIIFGNGARLDLGYTIVVLMIIIYFSGFYERTLFFLWTVGIYFLVDWYILNHDPLYVTNSRTLDRYLLFFTVTAVIAITIHGYISENRKKEELNLALLKQYKRQNKELERFTYIASHDLKTPLRTIVSFLGVMRKDLEKKKFDRLDEHLDFAQSGARQMYYLITDILEYSKVEHVDIPSTSIDLNTVLVKVKHHLADLIGEKNVLIQTNQNLPTVIGNETQWVVLFQNMIENGIKYNESQQPRIIINSDCSKDVLKLSFQDNGIGIDEQYADQIFEMFRRLHSTNEYQGTGIGLAICKRIVDHYGGNIWVESGKNVGSVFFIEIPLHGNKTLTNVSRHDESLLSI